MCAIFGWLDYKGIVNSKVLNKLTQALANAAEERGTDAAGIAYVQDGRVTIYKRPKPAHKLRFKIPKGTKAVMGHTRYATQGDKEHNYNNHPFAGRADKSFALAHNGVIWNDRQLRKLRDLPASHIETDSYIAVQLIENCKKLDFHALKCMAEDVEGTFNFTVLDEDNTLYFVKGVNPLTILHFEVLGIYIYASTDSILSKALSKSIFGKFAVEEITLHEGDILSINDEGLTQKDFFYPTEIYYSNYYGYGYLPWSKEEDDEEPELDEETLQLYELAEKYCGISADIVSELLDYGYTPCQIEVLLYDPELLDFELAYIRGEGDWSYDSRREYQDSRYNRYIDL